MEGCDGSTPFCANRKNRSGGGASGYGFPPGMLRTWSGEARSTQNGPPSFHLLECYHFGSVDGKSNRIMFMGNTAPFPRRQLGRFLPNPKMRLKEQFHEVCRFRHVAVRTEEAYWGWVVRLLVFHKKK